MVGYFHVFTFSIICTFFNFQFSNLVQLSCYLHLRELYSFFGTFYFGTLVLWQFFGSRGVKCRAVIRGGGYDQIFWDSLSKYFEQI